MLRKDKVREDEVALDFHVSFSGAVREPTVCLTGTPDMTAYTMCHRERRLSGGFLSVLSVRGWRLVHTAEGGCDGTSQGMSPCRCGHQTLLHLKHQSHIPITGSLLCSRLQSLRLCVGWSEN